MQTFGFNVLLANTQQDPWRQSQDKQPTSQPHGKSEGLAHTHCGSTTHYSENRLKAPFALYNLHILPEAAITSRHLTPDGRVTSLAQETPDTTYAETSTMANALEPPVHIRTSANGAGEATGEILHHQLPQLTSISWSHLYNGSNLSVN